MQPFNDTIALRNAAPRVYPKLKAYDPNEDLFASGGELSEHDDDEFVPSPEPEGPAPAPAGPPETPGPAPVPPGPPKSPKSPKTPKGFKAGHIAGPKSFKAARKKAVDSRLAVGIEFDSFEDAEAAVHKYAEANGNFTVSLSLYAKLCLILLLNPLPKVIHGNQKKDVALTLVCDRAGYSEAQRKAKKNPDYKPKRERATKRCGCPWKCPIYIKADAKVRITGALDLTHNHPLPEAPKKAAKAAAPPPKPPAPAPKKGRKPPKDRSGL
jgi:hypothetical protein